MIDAEAELREPSAEELREMATAAKTLVDALRSFDRVRQPSGRDDVEPTVVSLVVIGRAVLWLDACPYIATNPPAKYPAVTLLRAAYRRVRKQIPVRPDGPPGPVSFARPLVAAADVDGLASEADAVERLADALSAVSKADAPEAANAPEAADPTPACVPDYVLPTLRVLVRQPEAAGMSRDDLACEVSRDPRTVGRHLQKLIAAGLVDRPGKKSGVLATPKGRQLIGRLNSVR